MMVITEQCLFTCVYIASHPLFHLLQQWLTTVNGIGARIPGCLPTNGQLKIREQASEAGKKTIPETVNEENLTTGYVASIQPYSYHSNR